MAMFATMNGVTNYWPPTQVRQNLLTKIVEIILLYLLFIRIYYYLRVRIIVIMCAYPSVRVARRVCASVCKRCAHRLSAASATVSLLFAFFSYVDQTQPPPTYTALPPPSLYGDSSRVHEQPPRRRRRRSATAARSVAARQSSGVNCAVRTSSFACHTHTRTRTYIHAHTHTHTHSRHRHTRTRIVAVRAKTYRPSYAVRHHNTRGVKWTRAPHTHGSVIFFFFPITRASVGHHVLLIRQPRFAAAVFYFFFLRAWKIVSRVSLSSVLKYLRAARARPRVCVCVVYAGRSSVRIRARSLQHNIIVPITAAE